MSRPSKNSKTRDSAPLKKDNVTASSQSQRFINFAREIETDESEERFDAALAKVARHKPPPDAPKEPKDKKPKPAQ
jgi:hypothetical protein